MALRVNTLTHTLLEDDHAHSEAGLELRTSSLLVVGWMIIQRASAGCSRRHYRWAVLNFHSSFHSVYEELLRLTSATARQTFEHLKVTGAFVTHKLSHVARSRTSEHISRALRARLLWLGLHNFALLCSEQYASTKVFVPL